VIYFVQKNDIARIAPNPAAACYYFGLDLPAEIPDQFACRPLIGLTELAKELKEEMITFVAAMFASDDSLPRITASLAENAYGIENLFLDICYLKYVRRLIAERTDCDPLVLVFASQALCDAAFAYLQGETGEECRKISSLLTGIKSWTRNLYVFLRSRYSNIKRNLAKIHAAHGDRPILTGEPISLVRTWLDGRNFTGDGFQENYLITSSE